MAKNERVQNIFLAGVCSIYLIAFVSVFVQIPGLYGDNGILPVRLALNKDLKSITDILKQQPTLLHFFRLLGFTNVQLNLNVIAFLGVVLSFASFVTKGLRNVWSFAILFILYQSIVQVGQTFLWFQWDTLLLEVGFLCILVAPLKLPFIHLETATKHSRYVSFWLVRWLAFRLMFCSGVVKLNSQCPTWWGLTAMTYHYESQCIPTPLSWFFHHLPLPFHRLSNAIVFLIQIVSSILFFSPSATHRLFSFAAQTSLMVLIALTGNYNFFNLLSIFLLLSLLDDPKEAPAVAGGASSRLVTYFSRLTHLALIGLFFFIAYSYFGIKFSLQYPFVLADIQFTYEDLQQWLHSFLPISIWIATASLAVTIGAALVRSMAESSACKVVGNLLATAAVAAVVVVVFATSLVSYTVVDRQVQSRLPGQLFEWSHNVQAFHVINSYGLFRSMTGVGGRPEVVVEGQEEGGAWKEYEFLYKPGQLDRMPPFVAPHQPRLDWQMWFAALGSFKHNPWFFNLVYRLLKNQPEVLSLIATNPFPTKAPSSLRAHLFHYHFSSPNQTTNWWTREWVREYMPAVSLDNEYLSRYVSDAALDWESKGGRCSVMVLFFDYLHAISPPSHAPHVCLALLLVAISCLLLEGSQPGLEQKKTYK